MSLCGYCGTKLRPPWQKKYCSRSCAAKINCVGVDRHAKSRTKPKPQNKLCARCGSWTMNLRYCSRTCRNISYQKYSTKEECQRARRAMHNEAWHRYMARRRNQTPADADIKAMQNFYLNCPDGHEVDHIIPISRGGLHTLSNLQYLPWLENRRKHAKLPHEMAPVTGVEPVAIGFGDHGATTGSPV